jgi:hypothetical protein
MDSLKFHLALPFEGEGKGKGKGEGEGETPVLALSTMEPAYNYLS